MKSGDRWLLAVGAVAFLGGLLSVPVTAQAEDKPIVGKPIIKKDPPPPPKKDGETATPLTTIAQ